MNKNIHILATDKPSRIWVNNLKRRYELETEPLIGSNTAMHIYITSDLEIKEGDWCINKLNEVIQFGKNYDAKSYKKIILTTDPDLIADGVQSIDDEFLEWFVKNPSCEYVEFERVEQIPSEFTFGMHGNDEPPTEWVYKIILPQEEPKQDIIASEEDAKIFVDAIKNPPAPNETLEEAMNANGYHNQSSDDLWREGVEFGAKWQAERMYSEKECYQTLHALMMEIKLNGLVINDDIDLKKWFNQNKKTNNP